MRVFTYKMKFDNSWVDVSSIINSENTTIKNSLCTTKFKSVTNSCSFTLVPSNALFYAQIVDKIIKARSAKKDVDIEIFSVKDGEVLFGGILDTSKLSITSSKLPESVDIEGQDYIVNLLDKKINLNLVYEDKKVSEIVKDLLRSAGYEGVVSFPSNLTSTCKYFVTTDDDDATYRDIIDTLLYEVPGYVIYRNPKTSEYEIREIVPEVEPTRHVSYMVSEKLTTDTSVFDEDGIKVTYPTVAIQQARPVYVESLTESNPAEIASLHYYPENGDIQATYQEYNKNLLDRDYNTSVTRTQNSDLDILYVKNPKVNIYPKDDSWEFPVLSSLEMPSNPVWYPRKAWILIRNKTEETQNLSLFNIEGDVVYKSKINNITLPATAEDPDEYESSYIFDEEHASKFAKWYYGMKTISSTTTTWTEPVLYSYVGEKVIVEHKDSSVSQGHVVVQINNVSLSGGVRGYQVTAVAVSDFSDYEYAKDVRINGSSNKSIFREYTEYYNSTSYTELIGGSWSDTLSIDPDKILWTRRVVLYLDGTSYYSTPAPSGAKGADGKDGKDGTDGSYLSFDISRTLIDYYADNVPVDNSAIIFTAQSDINVTITIDGKTVTETKPSVYYESTPTGLFGTKNSILATATTNKMLQTFSVAKNYLTGSLTLSADKTNIAFYADNVAHDASDKITLSISSENYYYAPRLYLNGVLQSTEDSASYTFEIPQSSFADVRDITVKVTCGSESQMITLSKVMDTGSISIASDKSEIGYYADNVPLNNTETAILSVTQSGFSKLPTLTINGIEKEYTSTVLTDSATYTIKASDIANISKITAQISIVNEIQSITVVKTMEQATIALSVSEGVAEYYYDNVAITGDMTATVTYSGLYYPPLLKAGETSIVLDTDGHGTIPISLFDNVDNGLVITAYAQKYISYSTSVNIPKTKRPLVLSLGNSGSQFSYDNDGNPSPASITLTNYTSGLSDKGLVTLVVGGVLKSWTDGTFTVTPDMVTGRFLTITVSYGNESSSLIITKTYDGKAEIIEYSKTKSFKIYPDEEYEFTYNDTGVVYNGETMTWVVPWSTTQPDISSNEYLWRRSRNSDTDAWQYTRITGIKGDDGKAGEYLGHYLEAPPAKPDGSDINDGDYYLNTSEVGAPLPYIYKDGEWTLVTADNPMWSQIAAATMGDVNNYGGALLSTSAYYGYFQALTAQKAFITSLGAQEITLNDGGSIKSSNYDSSNGAEGFKIDADGNCNFSTGTWRGSFANGLSFIPPTNVTIKKTMTQKEAYQALKKAGVVSGVYRTTTANSDLQNTGTAGYTAGSGSYSSLMRTGNGFTCLDYDSLDMQTPLFSPFIGIIPIDGTYMIGILIETYSSGTIKTAYLITKSMLAKHQWNDIFSSGSIDKSWAIFSHPLTDWSDRIVKLDDYYAIYGTVIDGKLILMNSISSTGFSFSLYHVDGDNMTLVKDGDLDLGSSSYSLTRWLIPAFYYHKKGSYYETSIWTGADTSDFNHFTIAKTTDFLTYETVKTITLNYSTSSTDLYNIPIPADMVYVDNRVFAQIVMAQSDGTYLQGFAEYNESASQWGWIPDNYTQYTASSQFDGYCLPSLYVKDNVIYGTYSGHEFFSYDTNTNEYKDLSEMFRTSLLNQPPSAKYDNSRTYITLPPHYASRIDSDVTRAITGSLPTALGSFKGKDSISLDTKASYLVAKYGNEWIYGSKSNNNTYQFYTANGTIKNFNGWASSISIPADYQKKTLTFYAMDKVSISKTTYDTEPSVTDTGCVRNVDVTYTFTNTDSSVYTEHLQLTETTHYSKYMEWDTLKITAIAWSSALNAIMLTVKSALYENALSPYVTLVYDIETGIAKSLSPLTTNLNMGDEMLPLCQYAETDNDYIAIGGSTAYASSVSDSDKMSFTMNNIYFADLLDYYNGTKTIENIMFPSPSSVPAIYRSWAKRWADILYKLMANALEYDNKRLIRNDDAMLTFNCVIPYFAQNKMIVRETDEKYEIFLADAQWRYFMAPTFTVYPSFWESAYSTDMKLYYSMFYFKFEISPNSNMYPIISIDKDSEELMTATFTWDFPAQLTTDESIKSIAKDDFFCSPLNLVYLNAEY